MCRYPERVAVFFVAAFFKSGIAEDAENCRGVRGENLFGVKQILKLSRKAARTQSESRPRRLTGMKGMQGINAKNRKCFGVKTKLVPLISPRTPRQFSACSA